MAKSPIIERLTKTIEGILNVDNKSIEVETLGELDLSEQFKKFDGELVKIQISLVKK